MVEEARIIVIYRIRHIMLHVIKLIMFSALFCSGLSETTSANKKPSMRKRVKKALLSRPAKIAYGYVAVIALLYDRKKYVDEKERVRSLRNGKIVYSALIECQQEKIRERFITRYMPESRHCWYHSRPYFYSTHVETDASGTIVIIRDNGISRSNSIALLHRIRGDIDDMNAYAQKNEKSIHWTAVIERYKVPILPGAPLREDFDVPRYQLKIRIPNISGV